MTSENNKPGQAAPPKNANQERVGRFLVTSVSNQEIRKSVNYFDADAANDAVKTSKPAGNRWLKWAGLDYRRWSTKELKQKSSDVDDGVGQTALTLYEDDILKAETGLATAFQTEDDTGQTFKANLGTFLGVFLPCCQNIVGVIFFVRFPWIVGTSGVLQGLTIVGLCSMVSVCTAISISAIATNGRVTAGGTYFMISRSLGPGFGGSVGILFFMGTSISVAMYYIGTIETLLNYIAPELSIFSDGKQENVGRFHDYRVYGSILLVIMGCVVFLGVTCVQRFAACAIVFHAAGLLCIFTGVFIPNDDLLACRIGNRMLLYKLVHYNDTWHCDKEPGGPIYENYCQDNGTCEDYFLDHQTELFHPMPGLSMARIIDSLSAQYSDVGDIPSTDTEGNQASEVVSDITTSFVVLMGIYFPSITGVESGSNYSGDLKNPQVSIPVGTILAVTVTTTLYMSAVVLFTGAVDGGVLRDKYGVSISDHGDLIISLIAWPSKWVVLVATLTATVGAGLQALAGGPRLLQAIADDGIYPSLAFFSKKWKGEPTRCLAVTFFISLTGILIARLDNVAIIVTMFFLMCYGFVNFAVTLQSLLDLPHWRPSFRCYHWTVTLFGTSLCITIMFMTSWIYAMVSITLAFCLYQYIEFKGAEKEWGDGMTGLSMSAAIFALSRLKRTYHHTKSWRPQMLVLLKSVSTDQTQLSPEDGSLVHLSTMLQAGRGLCMFGTIIQGKMSDNADCVETVKEGFGQLLDQIGTKGFVEVVVAPNVSEGLCYMIQSAGIGPLRPNTTIIGWPKDWMKNRNILSYHVFLDTMRNIALTGNAVLVLKSDDFPSPSIRITGHIDIWWIVNDGGMLVLLAHLLTRHKTWSRCDIRVFAVADENDNTLDFQKSLQDHLYNLRVNASVEIVEMKPDDISAYVYERTLKMEERTRMLETIAKTKKRLSKGTFMPRDSFCTGPTPSTQSNFDVRTLMKSRDLQDKPIVPSEKNMRNMRTAIQLNALIKEKSASAELTIINLPSAPESTDGQANYMSFLEVLSEGMNRLLLVRGTGGEVITIFN